MSLATLSVPGSGRRKAAIALVALGAERAAALTRELSEPELRGLASEIAALGPVSPDEVRTTLAELHTQLSSVTTLPAPGVRFARDLLVRTLGQDRGELLASELERPRPFGWLAEADPDQAADALAAQPPAALAVALVHLEPKPAAALLSRLPDAVRQAVATRIATLQTVHPDTALEVEATLRSKVTTALVSEVIPVQGTALLADILTFSSRDAERSLIQALAATDPELAEKVKAALFTFDDVAALESRALQTLLKAVDSRELAVALKNAPEEMLANILGNLSERARENLLEEIDLLTTIRPAEVHQARLAIVAIARRLEDEGSITIARPDDDE